MEEYDVFLSFRGIDTRKGFTSHIHRSLERENYTVFIDYKGLERGSSIKKSLLKAIKNSHSSIPIISENYASSTACLRELAQIVECKKTRGQTVIPVFYHVDPSLLKNLRIQSYKKEFKKYCSDPKYKPEEVQSWKDALAEVCGLAGWTIDVRDNEGQMIKKIVADIRKRVAGKEVNDELLKKLRAKLPSANSLMDDAEAKQFQNPNVREWLAELKATMYDADDLMDEIDAEALRCMIESESGSCFKKVRTDFSTAFNKRDVESKTKEILDRLEDILKQKDYIGLKGDVSENPLTRTPETSLVDESGVYGRDGDKNAIVELLLSDEVSNNNEVSVIVIDGVAGIGKTTLARLFYNDDRVQNHFQIKAWVCVSDDFNIFRITKDIFESVTSRTCDISTNLNRVQENLQQALVGKKFLIVLDDVWNKNYLEWDKLKSPLLRGVRGCTILVTTRSEDIANMMQTVRSYKLEVMSEADCWSLFVKHADLKPGAHPKLEDIGRKIVNKCKGLPLAVKALGGALRNAQNPQNWNDVLKSEIWEWPEEAQNVLPSLWLSYYYLPPHLKRCFAYCSIFPKDYEFDKENLILLWMGENLLKPHKNKSIEEVGEEYFNILLARTLFQGTENGRFIMHDLINDLAKYASCESCLRLDDKDLKDAGKATRRVSCMRKLWLDIKNLKDLRKVEKLYTLLLTSRIYKWSQDFENHLVQMLESMRYLRVLEVRADVGVCGIRVFKSIAKLKLLRYLRFDGVKIEEIHDSFCTLYNLQTLILRDCGFTKLPDSIGKLKELRHLDLSGSSITEIPDSICSLESLRHLDLSKNKIKELPDAVGNLHELRTLKLKECCCSKLPDSIGKLKQLRHLDLSGSSIAEIPDSICSLESLRHLDLSGSSIIEIPDSICNLESLRYLDLSKSKIKELPDTVSNLHELRTLNLKGCGCTKLPDSIGKLKQLSHLDLSYSKIKELPDTAGNLHELRTLNLTGCLIKSLPNSITMLTNLRHLILDNDLWMPMPTQMSKLENLQTMPRMKLGKDTGGNIKELGKLQHLQGKVFIGGLENVGNAEDARGANLKDKKGIAILRLKWTEDIDDSQVARAVLDRLQPHTNLRELEIYNYGGTSFPSWFGYESFSFIKRVKLEGCKNCTKLPALGQLPSLEGLWIEGFDKLERIGNEFYYSSDASSSVITKPFKSLKFLSFESMAEWKEWSVVEQVEGSGGAFSNLEKLDLSNCPKLKGACLPEYLPSLRDLVISVLENIKAFPVEGTRLPSNIQSIAIEYCKELESFSEEGWPSNLTELRIYRCKKLFAAKQWNLGMLSSLTSLGIQDIKGVIDTFPEKEGQLPTSLTSIDLRCMRNLKSLNGKAFQRLTSLQKLLISGCRQLQCLGEETLPSSISELWISGCPLLEPRCQRETGEDWSKILHIPHIKINCKRI